MVEHHRLGEVVMLTLIDHLHHAHFRIHIFSYLHFMPPVSTLRCLLVDLRPLDLAQARLAGGLAPQVMHLQTLRW